MRCTARGVLARVISAALFGLDACPVAVEVDVSFGLPQFRTVGLPDASVRESRERVWAAIRNSGFAFPAHRVTVNLAPADVRKEGASFDLPIALGILAASGGLPRREFPDLVVLGELSLDGGIQPVRGVLPIAAAMQRAGARLILLPRANAAEAALVERLSVLPVSSLADAVRAMAEPGQAALGRPPASEDSFPADSPGDLADIAGQPAAKRALEIAAAGAHNMLLLGPPGAGKTMLARRIPTILPPMSREEALEATAVHSVAGLLPAGAGLLRARPFRAPHHTCSDVALIGGGSIPRPGEVSLAHNGVLFLDELPEFDRSALETLRQPLEEGTVAIARAARTAVFPARVLLIAAMNPCPCGHAGHPSRECLCTPLQIARYRGRISGPLLDRIDLHVEVPPVEIHDLTMPAGAETSAIVQARVTAARQRQLLRFRNTRIRANAHMSSRHMRRYCRIDTASIRLLEAAATRLGLSARAFDRILRVARTIADLDCEADLCARHVAEAVQYRALDRTG